MRPKSRPRRARSRKVLEKRLSPRRGAEDRVDRGLEILAAQLLEEVQADEEAGDEVVAGGGQTQAAAFQAPDAFQQVAVEDLVHAALDLFSEGPLKTGPEVLPPLAVQEKGEAFRRGSFYQHHRGRRGCAGSGAGPRPEIECGMVAVAGGETVAVAGKQDCAGLIRRAGVRIC